MLTLDGLEIIAVLVVMGLFIKVLEQFGMFEPVGGEGNGTYGRFDTLLTIDKLRFEGRAGVWVRIHVSDKIEQNPTTVVLLSI
ncbi:hypothetical protein D4764_11G0009850 [Takifugu flavidus]|uniref:Uncharacterized protein n=1 Tax=Takifugu flavidus TaxID=433684 RepID=A0A5C6PGE1_9TELE|nr:hypothetical protein D4764_11G0009850 [Takifugu flavidus]